MALRIGNITVREAVALAPAAGVWWRRAAWVRDAGYGARVQYATVGRTAEQIADSGRGLSVGSQASVPPVLPDPLLAGVGARRPALQG